MTQHGDKIPYWICYLAFWLIVIVAVVSCQPEATPVANVALPTPTEDIIATQPPLIRYVLGEHVQNNAQLREQISENGTIIPFSSLTEESVPGSDYDVIISYGSIDGWTQSPVLPTVSLVINPRFAPLDDDVIANLIRNSIDTTAIVNNMAINGTIPLASSAIPADSLRTELANMGYPDGFHLQMATDSIPQIFAVESQLSAINIETNPTIRSSAEIFSGIENSRLHLAIILWYTVSDKSRWTTLVGENNVIDLYQLPISYLATPDLSISIADNGFPIASHPSN